MYRNIFIVTTSFLLLFPSLSFANAGSPMMWFGVAHLFLIIVANYVSMLVGYYFIAPEFSSISGNQDYWGGQTDHGNYHLKGFVIGFISSYLATLLIEFPFVFFAWEERSSVRKLFAPFFIANSVTNLIMFILYFIIVSRGSKW